MTLALVACGESSRHGASSQGGAAGVGASSGSSTTGGTGGSGPAGGSAGSSGELGRYFEPGSRLKPRVLALDDGTEIIEGSPNGQWYDTELEFDCVFLNDEEGIERCFPLPLATGGVYSDASCTRPVIAASSVSPCVGLSFEYVLADAGVCAYRGFRVGAELPSSTPLFIRSFDGICMANAGENVAVHELEPMPTDAFVGMRRTERARAPGLDAYVREGDDGSWEIIGYFDSARDASCFESLFDWSPGSKCIPSFASWVRSFADSSCERPIADAVLRACQVEPPTTIISGQRDANACPATFSFGLHEIEDIREIAAYEVDDSGACVASATQPAEFYVPGEPIDLSTLPVLEELVVGTGELRARFSGFGGIPYVPIWRGAGPLIDESGGACQPFGSPDGTVRCVPTSSAGSARSAVRYEDASCSGAPMVPWAGRPTCPVDPPLPPYVLMVDPTAECAQGLTFLEAFAVTGESTPSTLYAKDATTGACGPGEPVSPTLTYLRLGEAVAPTEFPEIERTLRQ